MPPQISPATDPNEKLLPESFPDEHTLMKKQKGSVGPFIGTVIILVLLLAGALYYWMIDLQKLHTQSAQTPTTSSSTVEG